MPDALPLTITFTSPYYIGQRRRELVQESHTIYHAIFQHCYSSTITVKEIYIGVNILILILIKHPMFCKRVIEICRQNCVSYFKSSLHSLNSLSIVLCKEVSQIQRNKTVFKFYSGLFLTTDFFNEKEPNLELSG